MQIKLTDEIVLNEMEVFEARIKVANKTGWATNVSGRRSSYLEIFKELPMSILVMKNGL